MSVLHKLFQGNREEAYETILRTYQEQGYFVLSFLYFANIMHDRLLEQPTQERHHKYRAALEQSDLIMPDGIALQLFYWVGRRVWLQNLNGTDFIPYFFDRLGAQTQDVHIGFFTIFDPRPQVNKTLEQLEEAKQAFLERFGLPINFTSQIEFERRMIDSYDVAGYEADVAASDARYKILFMGTGTPAQEIRCLEHQELIRKHNILVINAGGTMDYISGFETRAPQWVVKARVLEALWRVAIKPGKNFVKVKWMFGIFRYWTYAIRTFLGNLLLKK